MKLNKTTAVVLAVLLTLVVLGTIIAILTGWFHPVDQSYRYAAGLFDAR